MSVILSPKVLFYIFSVFSLSGIIFTLIYFFTLSSTVITQRNIFSQFAWLIFGIISVLVMGQLYENNITNNITFIVGLYILYAFLSLLNLIYCYKIMLDGKSFNNTVITNYRKVIGISNILIFLLFLFSGYKDSKSLTSSPPLSTDKLIIGNIVITIAYLACILISIYSLYVVTSSIITYSITDG
jgi:hypothetical protein